MKEENRSLKGKIMRKILNQITADQGKIKYRMDEEIVDVM